MILVCGATGVVGSRIARRLAERGVACRALVRPGTDASALAALGVDIVRGDLREPATLPPAVGGVRTVVTSANAISRLLEKRSAGSIADVDDRGNAQLIEAAECAGVERFVFVSQAGLGPEMAALAPLAAAKLATEERLRSSALHEVLVRPTKFQEVWLGPQTGIVAEKRRAVIYGRGQVRESYVAVDDVAELCVRLALADDPPRLVEFGGPEQLTRSEVVDAFERAYGVRIRRVHIPRPALAAGARALRRVKPEVASLLGMALHFDVAPSQASAAPLEAVGIRPRSALDFIESAAHPATGTARTS